MIFSVDTDIAKAVAKLKSIAEAKQLRFAVAKALTNTAQDVQAEVIKNMDVRFTLRGSGGRWVKKGIRYKAATKENLMAMVYTMDQFMERQEHGGVKLPLRDTHLAVPMRGARKNKDSVIRQADLPNNLGMDVIIGSRRAKKGEQAQSAVFKGKGGAVFKIKIKGKLYLCRRKTPKSKLEVMYLLIPRAEVRSRLGLNEDGKRIAITQGGFARNLQASMEYAMRT